jgi:hypothetical protein
LHAGVPASHPVAGKPEIFLFFLPEPAEIGITVALRTQQPVAPSPFREISIASKATPRGPALSVSTANAGMFRQIFPVLLEIADAIQLDGDDPVVAAEIAVRRIANAIRLIPRLSLEQTLGLWGELWVLRHLVTATGPQAIGCWFGWERDRHDFRIDRTELEVKTTLGSSSDHIINGIGQLASSEGFDLYLLSVQVSRAPGGTSLLDQVRAIERRLSSASLEMLRFSEALQALGASPVELTGSVERFTLGRNPQIVPMSPSVPRLTVDTLATSIGSEALGRLGELRYRINLDGLGHEEGSEVFHRVLPWMTVHD